MDETPVQVADSQPRTGELDGLPPAVEERSRPEALSKQRDYLLLDCVQSTAASRNNAAEESILGYARGFRIDRRWGG